MKILYVHQYFRTPEEGGCTRSYFLAKGLVDHGHQVVVITAHNSLRNVKNVDGIEVHYLPVSYRNEFTFFRRIYAFLRFVRLTKKEVREISRIDLAYVMTTPLSTGLIALFLKKQLGIPYFFEVGDLWPEAPIQLGYIKSAVVRDSLYRFERKCYFHANKVIALSPSIRNYIESVSPQTKVNVIPNLSHCDQFEVHHNLRIFTKNDPLTIGYFGAIGKANHLVYLIECARSCQIHDLPVKFKIMGAGSEKRKIRLLAKDLPNVEMLDFGSADQVREQLDLVQAVYVSFKDVDILGSGSPNKFFDGLAAGKLTIINFNGWIKDLVVTHKTGFYHHPHRPDEFGKKIRVFLDNPELLRLYQRNSRNLAEQYYDRELQIQKLLKIVNNEKKISISDSEVYILTA